MWRNYENSGNKLPSHFYSECVQTHRESAVFVDLMMIMLCHGAGPEMVSCLLLYSQKLLVNYKLFLALGMQGKKAFKLVEKAGRATEDGTCASSGGPNCNIAVQKIVFTLFLILRLFHKTKQKFIQKETIRTH